MVSMVIAAPVDVVWRTFTDPARRATWVDDTEADTRLRLTVLEPGRRCVVDLAGAAGPHRTYAFTPVQVGAHRGGTVVCVVEERPAVADRIFDLVSGGFVARTVEGAVRKELAALAVACTTRVISATAA